MPLRRADVFFYGLFMDTDLLRDKGIEAQDVELASVSGYALRIGGRATLVSQPNERVFGVVMSITLADLERLYSEPSVQLYKPQAVLVQLTSGAVIAALCYVLPEPPAASERNPGYAEKLRAVAQKVGLPSNYILSIE